MTPKKKKHTDDVAGFRSSGEAAHHISKKMTQQTVPDKTKYNRKKKHKNNKDGNV